MKGMMSFLEKAGLVSLETDAANVATEAAPAESAPTAAPAAESVAPTPVFAAGSGALDLAAIYAAAGVPASVYPAERLLRVIDGLSAMEPAARHMAIRVIDEADESWSIDDPVRDAQTKIGALDAYRTRANAALAEVETQTTERIANVQQRREQVVADVRRQIAELDALIEREQTRAAQEQAALEANLAGARDTTARELAELDRQRTLLVSLTTQFAPTSKEA